MKPYYADDAVTLYHGDCREVLANVRGVTHVITDPPYSEQTQAGARTSEHNVFSKRSKAPVRLVPFAIDVEVLRGIFAQCAPMRWCIATVDWKHVARLEEHVPVGLRFVRFGVWVKPNAAPQFTGDRPATGWEAVAIMHNDRSPMRWNGRGAHAVWSHGVARATDFGHPTPKPIALIHDFVSAFTDPGDVVLDPFAGSGTTARACKDLGRRCVAIEQSEAYCEVIARRLAQETLPLGEPKASTQSEWSFDESA